MKVRRAYSFLKIQVGVLADVPKDLGCRAQVQPENSRPH